MSKKHKPQQQPRQEQAEPPDSTVARHREMLQAQEERLIILNELGFVSCEHYLLSPLWKKIRKQVMDLYNGECVLCHRPAQQVHHMDYTRATMRGDNLDALIPLCALCHHNGEFRGRLKVPLAEANNRMRLVPSPPQRERTRQEWKTGWNGCKYPGTLWYRRHQQRRKKRKS